MKVLMRVFALRPFRQSALCVQRIAALINNSGDVERQGLHIVLHRSHADRKAQRVLNRTPTTSRVMCADCSSPNALEPGWPTMWTQNQ